MGFHDRTKETADKATQSINRRFSGGAAGAAGQYKQAQQQLDIAVRALGIATFDLAQSGQLSHPALEEQLAAVEAAQQAAQAAQAAAAAPVERPPVPGRVVGGEAPSPGRPPADPEAPALATEQRPPAPPPSFAPPPRF